MTSLPVQHFATLVRGAAAYALLWRAAERVDAFSARPNLPAEVLAAAAALLARFEVALTYLAALRAAGLPGCKHRLSRRIRTGMKAPNPAGSCLTHWMRREGNPCTRYFLLMKSNRIGFICKA